MEISSPSPMGSAMNLARRLSADPDLGCAYLGLVWVATMWFQFLVVIEKELSCSLSASLLCAVTGQVLLAIDLAASKQGGRRGRDVSLVMVILQLVGCVSKSFVSCRIGAYVPNSESGNHLYNECKVCTMAIGFLSVRLLLRKGNCSFDIREFSVLTAIAFVLAVTLPAPMATEKRYDIIWAIGFHLETLAPMPQLRLFVQAEMQARRAVAHCMMCLFFARVFSLVFWLAAWSEIAEDMGSYLNLSGSLLILQCVFSLSILLDFSLRYIAAVAREAEPLLATSDCSKGCSKKHDDLSFRAREQAHGTCCAVVARVLSRAAQAGCDVVNDYASVDKPEVMMDLGLAVLDSV